jgi:hypothetical protein
MRQFIIVWLLLFSPMTIRGQSSTRQVKPRPCRAQPTLIGKCFKVRGRLSLYNGAPTIRLWRAGTKRILGVSASYAQDGSSSIPAEIEKQLGWETELWGDYLVCPFTREHPGVMQMICIEGASRTSVRKRR